MIDWVTAIVPCNHPVKVHDGMLAIIDRDGAIKWQIERPESVVGSFDSSFRVKSIDPVTLYIDGNPAKWLQGHNLFGSDDLAGLTFEVLSRLIPILGLTPTEGQLTAWRNGNFALKRVDVTGMWALPRRSDVRAFIRAAEQQSKSRHGRPMMKHSTLVFGNGSRRWSLVFYSKGDELDEKQKGHALPRTIPSRDNLVVWADNKLRGELRMRTMQLKDKNLSFASEWKQASATEVLMAHIGTLQMSDQFSLASESIDGLPGRLVAVYKLWTEGEDLRGMFPRRTFYRYRSELLKRGIDISVRQPNNRANVFPLVKVLRPEAIEQVPDWAVGTSLYFDPKRLRA